jgi:hypothetical protein
MSSMGAALYAALAAAGSRFCLIMGIAGAGATNQTVLARGRAHELALIYQAKGMAKEDAQRVAAQIMQDKQVRHSDSIRQSWTATHGVPPQRPSRCFQWARYFQWHPTSTCMVTGPSAQVSSWAQQYLARWAC